MREYLVVGDGFKAVACYEHVYRASEILELIKGGVLGSSDKIMIGQGLKASDIAEISVLAPRHGIAISESVTNRIAQEMTHKRHPDHVLVSNMQKVGESSYSFSLLTNDQSDRLSDHVTGHHLGAMLLIEAARQSVICVLEAHYQLRNGERYGLVLSKFNTEYSAYCFPVEVDIVVDLDQIDRCSTKITTDLRIKFSQNGQFVSAMTMCVSLVESESLRTIENRKLDKCMTMLKEKFGDIEENSRLKKLELSDLSGVRECL